MRFTAQLISLLTVMLIILPRLLAGYGLTHGTIAIILYWVGMLVILPDYVKGFETNSLRLSILPITSKIILIIIWCYGMFCLINYNNLFSDKVNYINTQLRYGLYILHPLVCLSWIAYVKKVDIKKFIYYSSISTGIYIIAILIPELSDGSFLALNLEKFTAKTSGDLTGVILGTSVIINENIFSFNNNKITVGGSCAGVPQIANCIQTLGIFFITCPINNKLNKIYILIICLSLSVFVNTLRITACAISLEYKGIKWFDFWHEGVGSLIFSFITMGLVCWIYYYNWSKEVDSNA